MNTIYTKEPCSTGCVRCSASARDGDYIGAHLGSLTVGAAEYCGLMRTFRGHWRTGPYGEARPVALRELGGDRWEITVEPVIGAGPRALGLPVKTLRACGLWTAVKWTARYILGEVGGRA